MTALHRKLLRDLHRAWPQVVSIAAVLAAGIASLVALRGTMVGLQVARARLYAQTHFADAEARLERAPDAVRARLAALPGVRLVETRIVQAVTVPMPDDPLPPFGALVSLPAEGGDALNRVLLLRGRRPERGDEALLLARFATRQGLEPGATLAVVARGVRREFRITGLATSAEFVYPVPPGGGFGGEDERYAVLWVPAEPLARMLDLDGAFNDALVALAPGTSWPRLREAIEEVLRPYGASAVVEQRRQPSEEILRGEFAQLAALATVIPAIFLAVAAFLVNVVVSRLVILQRPEIAALRALGYPASRVAAHFLQFVAMIATLGTLAGLGLGLWLGDGLIGVYSDYFHLPRVGVRLPVSLALVAFGIALGASALGALASLRAVVRLAPAQAMRPPAPARYRRLLVDRLPALAGLAPTARIVLRELERQPVRALLSVLGVAAAVGILVAGRFNSDAIRRLLDLQFQLAAREDVSVSFVEPVPPEAIGTLRAVPGVLDAEGLRVVGVRLVHGPVRRDAALVAYEPGARLRRLVDIAGATVPMPPDGVLLSRVLAERLRARAGDTVRVEVLEGDRRALALPVQGVVDDMIGLQAYASPARVAAWLGQRPVYSLGLLRVDPAALAAVQRRVGEMGMVTGFTTREELLRRFRATMKRIHGTMSLIESLFAAVIAAGIVYNSARVALSQRGRDLASLRVLGFTRAEITRMLLGEQALAVLLALPLGLWVGRGFVRLLFLTVDEERMRIPAVVSPATDAFAVLVVVATALGSGWLIARRIRRLDLIAVLKTRE